MQEKKRFEGTLDESVASGLNAGIEVLMNQVRIVVTLAYRLANLDVHRLSISFRRKLYQDNIVHQLEKISN